MNFCIRKKASSEIHLQNKKIGFSFSIPKYAIEKGKKNEIKARYSFFTAGALNTR